MSLLKIVLTAGGGLFRRLIRNDTSRHFHRFKATVSGTQRGETNKDAVHTVEWRLATYVALHSKVSKSAEELQRWKDEASPDDPVQKASFYQEKCRALIINSQAPICRALLKADMLQNHYSLLIGQSADSRNCKYLGFAMSYVSRSKKKVSHRFLSLKPLKEVAGLSMATAVKEAVAEFDLKTDDLVAICTNSAPATMGRDGLFAHLENQFPRVINTNCVNEHFKCVKSDTLPKQIQDFLTASERWFNRGSKRKDANSGKKDVFEQCRKLFEHWDHSRDLYKEIPVRNDLEEILYKYFHDEKMKVLLGYVTFVLGKVEKADSLFRSEDSNPVALMNGIKNVVEDINSSTGERSKASLATWPSEDFASNLSPEDTAEVKEVGVRYATLVVGLLELRLSQVWKILEGFSTLNMALNDPQPDLEKLLQLEEIKRLVPEGQSDRLLAQWANLPQHYPHLRGHTTDVAFWIEVSEKRQAIPEDFELLSNFALKMLTIPYSSHVFQRYTDMMNDTKMKLDLLIGIMMIRSTVQAEGLCWRNFPLPDFVLA